MRAAATLLLLLTALGVSACGGGDESGEEEAERTRVECEGAAVTPDLPADFPEVEGVTFTKDSTAGASRIADGYYEGSLEDAYENFKKAIRDAGYSVIFDEIEEEDSEVAYSGGGESTSGIVALRENCEQSGRVSVHITNRPE